jgi:hypothetical protein
MSKKLIKIREKFIKTPEFEKYKFSNMREFVNYLKVKENRIQIVEGGDYPDEIEDYLESLSAWLNDFFRDEMDEINEINFIDLIIFLTAASLYE